jgi:hypothetical protein
LNVVEVRTDFDIPGSTQENFAAGITSPGAAVSSAATSRAL